MPIFDHPFIWDAKMWREQRDHDEYMDALDADHARDERAPQVPLLQRDERRVA